MSAVQAELSFVQSEKEGLVRQVATLSEDLSTRETSHRQKVSSLENKMEAKVAEYQIIISNMSSQNESMSISFKVS